MAIDDNPETKARKVSVAGETTEEHSLPDRIKFEEHQTAQTDASATPQVGRLGLGVFRTRIRNGRP